MLQHFRKQEQIASTFYINGKDQIGVMLAEVESWMQKNGFENIYAFRSRMSQSGIYDPAAYERVQFMKHFAGK